MFNRRKLGLDNFEYAIFILYRFFVKLCSIFHLIFIFPFKILSTLFYIIFIIATAVITEKSNKIFFDFLEVFYEKAYIEYIFDNPFRMNYYLFLYLFPQKKLNCRKELILHFKEVREQKRQKYLEELKYGHKIPCTPMYLYPCKLENFFSKYRFIKMIGFYDYFIKGKRSITFDS